jgi:pimeloyl-ACP methyl ester carboxylesterase
MDILFAPGFNSDGLNEDAELAATLIPLLKSYARATNGTYFSADLTNFQTFAGMLAKIEDLIEANPSLRNGTAVAVASSFGAWFLLLAMSRHPAVRFKRIVLVAPFVEVHSIYYKLWPGVRELPGLITGFWRSRTSGSPGFYVWPSQVREMLAPANNLYLEDRLASLAGQPITIVLSKGSYVKPAAVVNLALALGLTEKDIRTDLNLPLSAEDFEKVLIGL